MEEKLLALMSRYRLRRPARERWRVLIQSFSVDSLKKVHRLDRRLPLIQLFGAGDTSATVQAKLRATRRYAVGVGPFFPAADAALTAAAHRRCLDVHPYTVNEQPLMRTLITAGVDGMFTNFPDRLDEVLGKRRVSRFRAAIRAEKASAACRKAARKRARAR